MITKITLDTKNFQYFGESGRAVHAPSVIVWRGCAHRCEFDVKSMRPLQWAQRYTAQHGGAIKVDGTDRVTWYHNVNSMYTNGYRYESPYLILEVLPNWKLKISLTDAGREYALERLEGVEVNSSEWVTTIMALEGDLFEYALCNGWTLDPADDGRWFISLDASIDDHGEFDVKPGDLGWSFNYYAIHFVGEDLIRDGSVIFDCYYFGEESLDDQRYI